MELDPEADQSHEEYINTILEKQYRYKLDVCYSPICAQYHDAVNSEVLNVIAESFLDAQSTEKLVLRGSAILPDSCARWLINGHFTKVVPALGRIVPLLPHLQPLAECFLGDPIKFPWGSGVDAVSEIRKLESADLREVLLALFRLLSFDNDSFRRFIHGMSLVSLFSHDDPAIRYLAIRVVCSYCHAADAATKATIKRHCGDDTIPGLWEERKLDFRFLGLSEEYRWKNLRTELDDDDECGEGASRTRLLHVHHQDLASGVVEVAGILMPTTGRGAYQPDSKYVARVPTAQQSLQQIAVAVLDRQPVLVSGDSGSGKSAIIQHLAHRLGKLDSMVTLHINGQTDVKSLLGIYTTDVETGSFKWRPGALTQAVTQGNWVFFKNIDSAPPEVIGTLLPLLENRELFLSGHDRRVQAAHDFRLFASARNSHISPSSRFAQSQLLGGRFWKEITIGSLAPDDIHEIVMQRWPRLNRFLPQLLSMHGKLYSFLSSRSASTTLYGKPKLPTVRDICKLSARLQTFTPANGVMNDECLDRMFLDAVDCYVASIPEPSTYRACSAIAAEALHIDPLRRDFLISERKVNVVETRKTFTVGREMLRVSLDKSIEHAQSSLSINNQYTARLIERIAAAVNHVEPVLLIGETGIGKTSCVQFLASKVSQKLVVYNLSQQSESGDLLGSFKPLSLQRTVLSLKAEFDDAFGSVFSSKKNEKYTAMLNKTIARGQWAKVCQLWEEALRFVPSSALNDTVQPKYQQNSQPAAKKVKLNAGNTESSSNKWDKFANGVRALRTRLKRKSPSMAFDFVESNLVHAVRNGDWVLLDEINLASSDTLQLVSDLFGDSPALLLSESGSTRRVEAHPDFRIFAAMNPATDTGKRELPISLRSMLTEIYLSNPDDDVESLENIVDGYLKKIGPAPKLFARKIVELYRAIQSQVKKHMIVDGGGQKPHFSLRTLTRALGYASIVEGATFERKIFEGFCTNFVTALDLASQELVVTLIKQYLFDSAQKASTSLGKTLIPPTDGYQYIKVGQRHIRKGPKDAITQKNYIITPFIKRNIDNLLRAIYVHQHPILLQGPTSSGKTSLLEYVARLGGYETVRINNHEHTDLQEYFGTYSSDAEGQLSYQEGVLVHALKKGQWIILDELNLAPTEVLEALNRLLDDNRELLVPETQEVIRPHPNFLLFATQNPAGLYGGRKPLSRAFRNRFLEIHFDDIPVDELSLILHKRCQIPESWAHRIVEVYRELALIRQEDRVFEQKSFATLRDLFRWASRPATTVEELAMHGYMLLGERTRRSEDRQSVKTVIEKIMGKHGPRVSISEETVYQRLFNDFTTRYHCSDVDAFRSIVWTTSMQRLLVLVVSALGNNEPILLVGETGSGKTSICQVLAAIAGKELLTLNAHQNTDAGDLIGSQRPMRDRVNVEAKLRDNLKSAIGSTTASADTDQQTTNELVDAYEALVKGSRQGNECSAALKETIESLRVQHFALFEWRDGAIVRAMKNGQYFLLDEISLADDAVLERLNSILEPERSLLIAEKGTADAKIVACPGFQFLSTMNPGGDYGKRELSPALRNRLTEIWVPTVSATDEVVMILEAKLSTSSQRFAKAMVSFSKWFTERYIRSASTSLSIRDLLAWVEFLNAVKFENPLLTLVQGAALVFIDTLGANPSSLISSQGLDIKEEARHCIRKLANILDQKVDPLYFIDWQIYLTSNALFAGPFSIPQSTTNMLHDSSSRGGMSIAIDTNDLPPAVATSLDDFSVATPVARSNVARLARAMQLSRSILMEGNPGAGKTKLVMTLAKVIGQNITRINLSEQTDLIDLFGLDAPVPGAAFGSFVWKDAPFLRAMKRGDWVLLDELNLVSQSVIEGLNACLDHRGEVYIPELDQYFERHPNFRVFATQNPHHQGGGRKGLPASFVNRFTVVYIESFGSEDLAIVCQSVFPNTPMRTIQSMATFFSKLQKELNDSQGEIVLGGPWELNVRDMTRWLKLLDQYAGSEPPERFLGSIVTERFRSVATKKLAFKLFKQKFPGVSVSTRRYHNLGPSHYQVGVAVVQRHLQSSGPRVSPRPHVSQLPTLEAMLLCVNQAWPIILVGPSGSGKSSIIKYLASVIGNEVEILPINAETDATDLLGGYDTADSRHRMSDLHQELERTVLREVSERLPVSREEDFIRHLLVLLSLLRRYRSNIDTSTWIQNVKPVLRDLLGARPIESLAPLLERVEQLEQSTIETSTPTAFEWIDGLVVRALKRGSWLVLDNANLCSSSVLDRLNALLEPEGELVVHENTQADGEPRVIRPHPNFRLFLTCDPQHGELSRAMRNRGLELYVKCHKNDEIGRLITYDQDSLLYRARFLAEALEAESNAGFDYISPLHLTYLSKGEVGPLVFPKSHDFSNRLSGCRDEWWDLLKQEPFLRATDNTDKFLGPISAIMDFPQSQPLSFFVNELLIRSITAKDSEMALKPAFCLIILHEIAIRRNRRAALETRLAKQQIARMPERETLEARLKGHSSTEPMFTRISTFVEDQLTDSRTTASQAFLPASVLLQLLPLLSHLDNLEHQVDDVEAYIVYVAFCRRIESSADMRHIQREVLAGFCQNGVPWEKSNHQSVRRIWEAFCPKANIDAKNISHLSNLQVLLDGLKYISRSLQHRRKFFELQSLLNDIMILTTHSNYVDKSLERRITHSIEQFPQANEHVQPQKLFFKTEFEALCQLYDINSMGSDVFTEVSVTQRLLFAEFAGRDNLPVFEYLMRGNAAGNLLHLIRSASGSRNSVRALALDQILLKSLVRQTGKHAAHTQLYDLDSYEEQLRQLARGMVSFVNHMGFSHQISSMDCGLASLVRHLLEAQDMNFDLRILDNYSSLRSRKSFVEQSQEDLQDLLRSLRYDPVQTSDRRTRRRFLENAVTAIKYLFRTFETGAWSLNVGQAAETWIRVALISLDLFLPNSPYDPLKDVDLERHVCNYMDLFLMEKIKQLGGMELLLTGQTSNLLIEDLWRKRDSLNNQSIFGPSFPRPLPSRTNEIFQIFRGLRRIIEQIIVPSAEGGFTLPALLSSSLQSISTKLYSYAEDYMDLVTPLLGFLECLQLGIALWKLSREVGPQMSDISSTNRVLIRANPFFGGTPKDIDLLPQIHLQQVGLPRSHENLFDLLQVIGFNVQIHRPSLNELQFLVEEVFRSFYLDWKVQLQEGRAEMEMQSKGYHYRGQPEDPEPLEESDDFIDVFREDRENDGEPHFSQSQRSLQARASEIAKLHAIILDSTVLVPKTLDMWIFASADQWQEEMAHADVHPSEYENVLPASLLLLRRKLADITAGDHDSKQLDFYSDPNLVEAKRLQALAAQFRSFFGDVAKIWPEHAIIFSILNECAAISALPHTTSASNLLQVAESLHRTMCEWQAVANREHLAPDLMDHLAKLIISWRQLELVSWRRLLDTEVAHQRDQADTWWFAAYDLLIADSASHADVDLIERAESILSTLHRYMSQTQIGQFQGRMSMLTRFVDHISFIARQRAGTRKFSALLRIGLSRLLDYFSNANDLITAAIFKARDAIGQEIEEVIKLTDWKKRDIGILRTSSRKSRQKLLKHVRKFRSRLTESAEPFVTRLELQQQVSMKDHDYRPKNPDQHSRSNLLRSLDPHSPLSLDALPPRLTSQAILLPSESPFDLYLQQTQDFLDFVRTSREELRKDTPKVASEDAQHHIRQLTHQKRQLFAEVHKALKGFGFTQNMASDRLSEQETLARICARSPCLDDWQPSDSFRHSERSFFKAWNCVLQIRQGAKDPSHLSNADRTRSTSLAESILGVIIRCQDAVMVYDHGSQKLRAHVAEISGSLKDASSDSQEVPAPSQFKIETFSKVLAWLPPILRTASGILNCRDELSNSLSDIVQSGTSRNLTEKALLLEELRDKLSRAPILPSGAHGVSVDRLQANVQSLLGEIKRDILMASAGSSNSFVLDKLLPWMELDSYQSDDGHDKNGVAARSSMHHNDIPAEISTLSRLSAERLTETLRAVQSVPEVTKTEMTITQWCTHILGDLKAQSLEDLAHRLRKILSKITEPTHIAELGQVALSMQNLLSLSTILASRAFSLHKICCSLLSDLGPAFFEVATHGFCMPAESGSQEGSNTKDASGTGLGAGDASGAEDITADLSENEDLGELAESKDREDGRSEVEDDVAAADVNEGLDDGQETFSAQENVEESGSEAGDEPKSEVGSINSEADASADRMRNNTNTALESENTKDNLDSKSGKDETQRQDAVVGESEAVKEDNKTEDNFNNDGEDILPADLQDETKDEAAEGYDKDLQLPEDEDDDSGLSSLDDEELLQEEFHSKDDEADFQMEENHVRKSSEIEVTQDQPEEKSDGDARDDEIRNDTLEEGSEEIEKDGPKQEDQLTSKSNKLADEANEADAPVDVQSREDIPEMTDTVQNELTEDPNDQSNGLSKGANQRGISQAKDQKEEKLGEIMKQLGEMLERFYQTNRPIEKSEREPGSTAKEAERDQNYDEEMQLEFIEDDTDDQDGGHAKHSASMHEAREMGTRIDQEENPSVDPGAPPSVDDIDEDTNENTHLSPEQTDALQTDTTNGNTQEAGVVRSDAQGDRQANDLPQEEVMTEDSEHEDIGMEDVAPQADVSQLSMEEARVLWQQHSTSTRNLSLLLAEHLRLILAPTRAIRMKGDFSTGKRLNLKRIIPFIASQYRRDKIWMRRSLPSKRSYQILLSIDDSKSMDDMACGTLAITTIVLVAQAMTMLEVGHLAVLTFGADVQIAHSFNTEFVGDAGPQAIRNFTFQQKSTNMIALLSKSLEVLREARLSTGGVASELWQIQFIISDGICEDHEGVRRVVRQAQEEHVLIIFIVVDAARETTQGIMDLQTATFSVDADGRPTLDRHRYMDSFPFPYYLIVRTVTDLPHVLADALRQWFAEINEG